MDSVSNINELKAVVKKFCEDRNWTRFHDPKELAIGMSTESNELLQLFRFKDRQEMEQMFNTKKIIEIEDELADVFYFILRFAQLYDIDLSDILMCKIKKNGIKYPVDKSKNNNKKYDELD